MHATKPLREVNRLKLPFAGYSVVKDSDHAMVPRDCDEARFRALAGNLQADDVLALLESVERDLVVDMHSERL